MMGAQDTVPRPGSALGLLQGNPESLPFHMVSLQFRIDLQS